LQHFLFHYSPVFVQGHIICTHNKPLWNAILLDHFLIRQPRCVITRHHPYMT
jgi:hypothetical protein